MRKWEEGMRETLEQLYGQRQKFSGTFERAGKKPAYRGWGTDGKGYGDTLLLRDMKDEDGRVVADHLWFNLTKAFRSAKLTKGDTVSFDARVDDYTKGYERDDYDYKLSRPTNVVNHGLRN
jgi:hypothetical protein